MPRTRHDREIGMRNRGVQGARHIRRRRVIFFADENLGRHGNRRHLGAQIEGAEHVARSGIRGNIALEENVRKMLRDYSIPLAETVTEPARLLERNHARESVGDGFLASIVPALRRILTVPRRRVDQRETVEHVRIRDGELDRDAAAHRRTAHNRMIPTDRSENLGDIVGELRRRIRPGRFGRRPVPATVVAPECRCRPLRAATTPSQMVRSSASE